MVRHKTVVLNTGRPCRRIYFGQLSLGILQTLFRNINFNSEYFLKKKTFIHIFPDKLKWIVITNPEKCTYFYSACTMYSVHWTVFTLDVQPCTYILLVQCTLNSFYTRCTLYNHVLTWLRWWQLILKIILLKICNLFLVAFLFDTPC